MKKILFLITLMVTAAATYLRAASLSVEILTIQAGQNGLLAVSMTNTETNLSGFQFRLYLPEGLSIATNENGKFQYTLGNRIANHSLTIRALNDGGYQFIAYSMDGDAITGTSGVLLSVPVVTTEIFVSGNGTISDIRLTDLDANKTTSNSISFTVTKAVPATGITLDQSTLTFTSADQMVTLTAMVTPANATNKHVTWTSSNTAVATVSNTGVVTPVADGTATITATTTDGTDLTATCEVTVNISSLISFADDAVKAICVANWDTNNDGEISEEEAAAVTDLGEVFKENTEITSFDELQYFTGLTGITEKAFNKCENLEVITLPSNITSIGSSAFDDCYALAAIDIPSSVTFIGGGAFSDCRTLTSLVLPNGITSIGNWLCDNCTGLTEMVIPNSVTSIGKNAFQGCTNIETITLSENLTSIGEYAFDACKALTSVDIPDGVTSIGHGAFRECNSLTSLAIPNSVTSIGNWAFEKCINITSFIIPENVTALGNGAFLNCSGLHSVVIPSGVTEIQGRTFEGCKKLTSVAVGMPTPLTITSSTFPYRANATLIVPNGCKSAYKAADYWKEFMEIIEIGDVMENVTSTYLTNADFEGEYSVYSYPTTNGNDIRAIYQPKGWTISYTNGDTYDLTALNSDCYQWNNFSSRTKPENGGSNTYWIRFRWGNAESLTLSQTVTLPAGTYKLSADAFFNGASGGSATISASGNNVSVEGNSTWSNYEVDFILLSETSVTFAFNLTQGTMVENIAGFDNFKLMYKENEAEPSINARGITLDQSTLTFTAADQTATLTATVTPANATNKNVTWTSSNAAVATVSSTGVVTAVAYGTATITATTTDGTSITATCQVTFNQCYTAYLQNVESGLFLTAANEWNTQASIDETGIPIIMEGTPESGYTLDTKIYYDATRHYLNINDKMYCDQPAGNWFFEEISNGIYALTLDNQKYIAYDGSSSVLILSDNGNDPKAQWRLVTEEMRKAELINATEATPLNATFLLPDANFSNENLHGNWQGSPTKNGEYANMNGEKFDTNFDVYQEITDVPNGFYVVKMQGFYREGKDEDWGVDGVVEMRKNGAEHLYAQFYVNEESMPVMSIFDEAGKNGEVGLNTELGYIPNSQSDASSYFSAGLYEHQLIVHVTDGTLRIGVRKQTEVYRDWTCFDNFRLTYCGTELHFLDFADSNVKAICVANWDTNDDGELSEAEAAAVTDLGEVFKENTEITSFNELQYFTGLTGIAEKAFNKCENLVALTLPNTITSIGHSAFDDCYALAAMDIPSSASVIEGGAFSDCRTLTSLVLPDGITYIGSWLCDNCTGLTEMVIPNSVTTIEQNAFAGCTNIETITLSENLTSIGNYAFQGCTNIETITLPESLASIGNDAFEGCNQLTTVIVGMTTPLTITSSTFSNRANATLIVPIGSKEDYQAANYWKEFKRIIEFIEGDVNGDGEMDVVDVVDIARFVVGTPAETFVEILADINNNGEVNLGDAVSLVNMIAGDQNFVKAMHAPRLVEMSEEPLMLESTSDGLSLSLENQRSYTAFQFVMDVPEGVDIAAIRINDLRKDGHQLLYNKVADNRYRVAVLSLSNSVFKGCDGELLNISLEGTGMDVISIHDIRFVTTNGTDISFEDLHINTNPTGISSIGKGEKGIGNVFDLSGRKLLRPQKGVNIVDGKKVIVR